jgi:hypothetical protein
VKTASVFVLIIAACSISLSAQWAKYAPVAVPRDAQGQVALDGPTPHTPDGKPDFTGTWMRADRDPPRDGTPPASVAPPADPKSPPVASFWDLGANLSEGLPLTSWAADLKKKRMAADSSDNPDANCLPIGITQFHTHPQPRKIIQTPTLIVILYEGNYGLRYIYTDGRQLPPQGEPQPWWYGYSIGHWEGDTLVVETNNLRGAESGPHDGWLDVNGSPYSEQTRFIERFRRPMFGKLEIDVTLEDPKSYARPLTLRVNQRLLADEELIETICNENQQFRVRIKVD